ncbi:MAG: hypothetical protein IK122_04095 [Alphaproteobacteria bacterium]|nr:hypothetical protein [Alphaproteobacteria bacterium]
MKKIMNKINFALIGLIASVPAFAAPADNGMCEALRRLHHIFEILRTAAFIGAAFYIAGWAWGYISKGEVGMDDVKKKGTALLVGFALLFMIGVLLSFIMSATGQGWIGCQEVIKTW